MAQFTNEEQQRIRTAIEDAEKHTSGQIRVCIEKKCSEDVLDRAAKYFRQLNMHKTKLRNGVLIYVATVDRKFAIIGDAGINKAVPDGFWDDAKEDMLQHFKYGNLIEGIVRVWRLPASICKNISLTRPVVPTNFRMILPLWMAIKHKIMFKKTIIFFSLLLTGFIANAQQLPAKSNTLVTDYTNTLQTADQQQLEQKLVAFDDSTSTQIAVVIIKSVGEYDIDDYGQKLGRAWGIGQQGKNNGILILVAADDRKVTIQTGYGAEGAVPDVITHQIIQNDIIPHFKQNDYYGGLNAATDDLMKYMKGEYKSPNKPKQNTADDDNSGGYIALGIIVLVILILIFKRGGGGGGQIYGGRGGASPFWWFLGGSLLGGSGGGWGGFSNGGGNDSGAGGGDFGGFGGGDFGGGGSSGSW